MAKPKYTDSARYPRGYKKALDTDITKTWDAARKKLEQDAQDRAELRKKIEQIPTIGKKANGRS